MVAPARGDLGSLETGSNIPNLSSRGLSLLRMHDLEQHAMADQWSIRLWAADPTCQNASECDNGSPKALPWSVGDIRPAHTRWHVHLLILWLIHSGVAC